MGLRCSTVLRDPNGVYEHDVHKISAINLRKEFKTFRADLDIALSTRLFIIRKPLQTAKIANCEREANFFVKNL